MKKTAVIGAGASGIMAAVTAARLGAEVTVFERNDRMLRKLLSTGNGRCNLSNVNVSVKHYNGKNTAFAESVLSRFSVEDTVKFFDELGLMLAEEDCGKLFPYSRRAAAVCDVLRFETERLGIKVKTGCTVYSVGKKGKRFSVEYNSESEEFDRVIISAGGKAAPKLGTDGIGYEIAKSFGHNITKLFPAIVQIKTDTEFVKGLKGIKALAKLTSGEYSYEGEVLFTEYGLSGPPAFSLSSYIRNQSVLYIDFVPEYSYDELYEWLKRRKSPHLTVENMLTGIMNRLVGVRILKCFTSVSPLKRENVLTDRDIKEICSALKKASVVIKGTNSWDNAQVTAGGVDTDEVNAKTMQSRLVNGLYFTGEILDIDGECGGYNLQWAWSSGYVAGLSAAK